MQFFKALSSNAYQQIKNPLIAYSSRLKKELFEIYLKVRRTQCYQKLTDTL